MYRGCPPFLDERGKIPNSHFPYVKTALHTKIVTDTIDSLGVNRVLNRRPPLIDKSESSLPRIIRVTLSQLRSGFCARLKDFQLRIGKSTDDLCPECAHSPQNTQHLFECPSYPTRLEVTSLWLKPWDAATFLRTLPSFNFFPDVGLQPPRNRRRHRPPPRPPDADQDDDAFSSLSLPPSPFLLTPPTSPGTPLPPLPPLPPPLMSIRLAGAYSSISSSSLSSLLSHDPFSSSAASQAPSNAGSDFDGGDTDSA